MIWEPTEADIAWCADLLAKLKPASMWGTTNGVYAVDKPAQRLTLVAKPPWFSAEDHRRNVVAFGRLGYEVVDGTASPKDAPTTH